MLLFCLAVQKSIFVRIFADQKSISLAGASHINLTYLMLIWHSSSVSFILWKEKYDKTHPYVIVYLRGIYSPLILRPLVPTSEDTFYNPLIPFLTLCTTPNVQVQNNMILRKQFTGLDLLESIFAYNFLDWIKKQQQSSGSPKIRASKKIWMIVKFQMVLKIWMAVRFSEWYGYSDQGFFPLCLLVKKECLCKRGFNCLTMEQPRACWVYHSCF